MPEGVGAAEAVEGNDDLKREILLRLPAKSATRFKLVSKQWLSLLSDPQFIEAHVRRNPNNRIPKGIFFCRDQIEIPTGIDYISFNGDGVVSSSSSSSCEVVPSLSFLNNIFRSTTIWLLQSCNGLFLCCVYPSPGPWCNYCVFNPTTKQYRLLPQPRQNIYISSATLAFDPSVSLHYKVILIDPVSQGNEIREIDVYSSEHQSWRVVSCGFQIPWSDLVIGKFFNGAIHWVGQEWSLCFDVYSEEMTHTKAFPRMGYRYIGDDGNHFHLVSTYICEDGDFFILELSRDFSNWVKKYKISALPEIMGCGIEISPYMVLCVVKGIRDEDSELVLKMSGKLVLYSFMNKEVKTLCGLPSELDDELENECIRAYPFIETLSSV